MKGYLLYGKDLWYNKSHVRVLGSFAFPAKVGGEADKKQVALQNKQNIDGYKIIYRWFALLDDSG